MRIPLPQRQERGTLQHRPPTAPGLEGSTPTSIPPFQPRGAFPQELGLHHAHTVLRAEAHRAPCASIAVPIYSARQRGCIKPCKGSGPSCSACLQQQGLSLQLRAHRVPQLILGLQEQDGKGAQPRICSLQWGRECCRCTVPHRSAAVKPTAPLGAVTPGCCSAASTKEGGEHHPRASTCSRCLGKYSTNQPNAQGLQEEGTEEQQPGGAWGHPGSSSQPRKGAAPFLPDPGPSTAASALCLLEHKQREGKEVHSLKNCPSAKFRKRSQFCSWGRLAAFCCWGL